MKKFIFSVLFFAVAITAFTQTTVSWNFGTSEVNPFPSDGLPVSNVSISEIGRGNNNGNTTLLTTTSVSGSYTGASGTFNAGAASRIGVLNTGTSGSAYFEITLTPAAGVVLNVTKVNFGTRSTSTGPQAFALRTSNDNFAADVVTGSILNNSTWTLKTNDVSITSGSGEPVTVRIYGYNGAGSASVNTANWRIDDLSLTISTNGTTPTCTPPTNQPTALNLTASATTINGSFATAASGTTAADKYLVLLSTTSILSQQPANGNAYTAGSQLGDALVVSSDNSTSFVATDLSAATEYYIFVYSYTNTNCYNLTNPLNGSTTTESGPVPTTPRIVINEIYGGGGNSGALYRNDFIELYNNESFAVNLSGWSVQYAGSTGATWQVTALSGTIPAKGYYLVQQAAGSGGTANLPVPDAIGGISMSATNGKVALVDNTTALSGACPTTGFIDLVGFGSANCAEGTAATAPSNTASLERITHGLDTDDNSTDFALRSPEPQNAGYTTTAPQVTAITPLDDATGIAIGSATTISFNKPVIKGTGSINIYENNVLWRTINVSDANVTVNDKTATINVTYNHQSFYYILVDAGAFKDQYGNNFAGITQATNWNFATAALIVYAPASFDFQNCINTLSDGFSRSNITGSQQWGCTTFGTNGSNGAQINGFANGAAQTNDAWLISPAINLSAITNIPALSFYSRGDFTGPKLQLYVSTTYSGAGVPDLAEWTAITTANFPTPSGNAAGVWTLTDNIDLSPYQSSEKLYIAFRYVSSPESGAARWAVDDIAITGLDALVNASPSSVNFGEVAAGQKSPGTLVAVKATTSGNVDVQPSQGFEISLDNVTYTTGSLTIDQAVAASGFDLYIRFAPLTKELQVTGSVNISSGAFSKNFVSLTGSSYLKSETFDVGTYNLSFFGAGSTNSFTEQQRATQVANVTKVFEKLNLDVIGVEEVSHDGAFNQLVSNLPGYAGVLSHRWSYSFEAPDPNFPPQKIGFVYNAQTMTLSASEPPRAMFESLYDSARLGITGHRLVNYPTGNPSSFWGSGRLPYLATFITNVNGVTKKVRVIVIHAKSGSTAGDFNRRLYDVKLLKDSIDAMYADDNVIILGDYNDRVIKSIYTGSTTSSYQDFVNDVDHYSILTYPLDVAGRSSFPSSNGLIDHIAISNELVSEYIENSTDIEDPRKYLSSYTSTTGSDHLPVYSRFQLKACPFTVSVPDVPAIAGGVANTLYTGYGPSTVTLYGSVAGESAPYTYSWTTGTANGPVIGKTAAIQVNPAALSTYVLTVHDKNGCYVPAVSKTISVVDVRCGNKMDKIMICQVNKNKQQVLCLDLVGAEDHIRKGAMLGLCPVSSLITQAVTESVSEQAAITFKVSPNPATTTFNVQVGASNRTESIHIKVLDIMGRVIETRNNIPAGTTLQLGNQYKPGIYLIELLQGDQRKQLKVIRQ